MSGVCGNYLTALGFLTRLGPARSNPDMAASIPAFPAVGLTLGLVMTLPLVWGLFAGHPLAGAFAYTVANIICTRGLHVDGFADVADAWGSLADGERFFTIMKDSRVGAFGAMAIAVAVTGQICLAAELLTHGRLWVLAVAPAFGRGGAVVLMRLCRDIPRPGLGALFLAGATDRATWTAVLVTLAASLLFLGLGTTLWAVVAESVVLIMLARLARHHGAINGDFIGAAIVAGELAVCLAGLC